MPYNILYILLDGDYMNAQQLRKSTGMSQRVFAMYFGIPVSTLQDWEHGSRNPPSYVISMMDRILTLEREEDNKVTLAEDHVLI